MSMTGALPPFARCWRHSSECSAGLMREETVLQRGLQSFRVSRPENDGGDVIARVINTYTSRPPVLLFDDSLDVNLA